MKVPSVIRAVGLAAGLLGLGLGSPREGSAQALADPSLAKALAKCSIVVQRTGTKLATKKLKALDHCVAGILKCLQTKPDVATCLDRARRRCEEQLPKAAGEEAKLADVVVRKCGGDLAAAALLDPAGLDWERLRSECAERFGVAVDDLDGIGVCLARQHACELERLFAVAAPRAAGLLAAAGVDPAQRGALACLTERGGEAEHVGDPRVVGRAVERCARAITNAGRTLVDASLKAVDRCLETVFTCVQVKTDPRTAPACLAKAERRCAVEVANLAAAASRPARALEASCGGVDYAVLASAEGLRIEALAAECDAAGAPPPGTLDAFADCLVRTHRCGVAELVRFAAPRAAALLAAVGQNVASLCPSAATPSPSATPAPTDATPSALPPAATPTAMATAEPGATATAGPTAEPTAAPGCADAYEPNAFPGAPASLNGQCGGGCTDDGYDLTVVANIADDADGDFYAFDVADTAGHDFLLQVQLSDVPDGTNYDLFLYRRNGAAFELIDQSTNDGTGNERVELDPGSGVLDASGTYGIEVRRVSGSSCASYTLEISDPS